MTWEQAPITAHDHPPIQVGQIWERRRTGRRVRITAVSPTNLLEVHHLDMGPRTRQQVTHPMACTLRTDYQLIHQPEEQP